MAQVVIWSYEADPEQRLPSFRIRVLETAEFKSFVEFEHVYDQRSGETQLTVFARARVAVFVQQIWSQLGPERAGSARSQKEIGDGRREPESYNCDRAVGS